MQYFSALSVLLGRPCTCVFKSAQYIYQVTLLDHCCLLNGKFTPRSPHRNLFDIFSGELSYPQQGTEAGCSGLRLHSHCVKWVCILSSSGPYLVQMRENTDQKNPKYGDFTRIASFNIR